MRCFFDTSVLIAAVLEEHDSHDRALRLYAQANPSQSLCAAHNLAEVYSILTSYPGKQRLRPDQALLALEEILQRLTIVSLDAKEYSTGIRKFASIGIVGGATYDALIAECALKAKADVLYTLNIRDFMRLGPEIAAMVKSP